MLERNALMLTKMNCFWLQMIITNLRGEMTVVSQEDESDTHDLDVVSSIARALQLSSSDDVEQVKELLIPTLFHSAVANSDLGRLEEIYQNVSAVVFIVVLPACIYCSCMSLPNLYETFHITEKENKKLIRIIVILVNGGAILQ